MFRAQRNYEHWYADKLILVARIVRRSTFLTQNVRDWLTYFLFCTLIEFQVYNFPITFSLVALFSKRNGSASTPARSGRGCWRQPQKRCCIAAKRSRSSSGGFCPCHARQRRIRPACFCCSRSRTVYCGDTVRGFPHLGCSVAVFWSGLWRRSCLAGSRLCVEFRRPRFCVCDT